MRVAIENPATGRPATTSWKHAHNYVKRKRAVWIKADRPTIRFIEYDHRHIAAKKCAVRQEGRFYEAGLDGLAVEKQMRGAGMVGDVLRLLTIGVMGDWAWSAAVFMRPMQNISNNEKPEVRASVMRARYAR